ncbi:Lrp/AsnC family transcriptional regulator [Candidatus Spongiihabitans sp.]|uniref:Lrp/AsnC family transcriptional regulator n=1 Tax=Candidatus Spongiihabitans sp. TaxID=3101308 RepID=UPI003C7D70BC
MTSNEKNILLLLEKDSRISIQKICRNMNISRSTAYNLINGLKNKGIIKRFTIERGDIDRIHKISAYIVIKCEKIHCIDAAEKFKTLQGAKNCSYVFGEYDFVIFASVSGIKELHQLRLDIHNTEGVTFANTTIVQHECF